MLAAPRSPLLEKDDLECPQHFGKFFVSAHLGAPEPSPGVILWDQVSDGLGGDWRSECIIGSWAGTKPGGDIPKPRCWPAKATSPGAGHFAGQVRAQAGLFPKATGTFMPQLLQKMHEFLSAKLTCSKRH